MKHAATSGQLEPTTDREMTMTKTQALEISCELAQKFGFVSRNIVWRHLAPDSTATRYRYWLHLKNSAQLSPYRSGISQTIT